MVEVNKKYPQRQPPQTSQQGTRPRIQSDISEGIDLTDMEHCILCSNTIKHHAMGKCNHKNVCHKCVLRIRLLMNDKKCSICKTELDKIVVSKNMDLVWADFNPKDAIQDKEDPSIFYEDSKAKAAGMELRSLQCLMYNCQSTQAFPNAESLRRHLETVHQKTFCKICLQGRTVFIREQRIYHLNLLRIHIEKGDPGSEKGAEVLPHPWCDFCEQYFFSDLQFLDHIQRQHLTCHLCGDDQKHVYYKDYNSLEIHFNKSHFLCPYDECKSKCYVAFQTENEVKAHLEIMHTRSGKQSTVVNANALLGFGVKDEDNEDERRQKKMVRKFELKDKEGVDFYFYFTQKYQMIHHKNHDSNRNAKASHTSRGGRGGRGRGGREGGANDRDKQNDEEDKTVQNNNKSEEGVLASQTTNEKKLGLLFQFLHKYLAQQYKDGIFADKSFVFLKVQQYQMYYALNRLDAEKFANFEFAINFGIQQEVKKSFLNALHNGGTYDSVCKEVFQPAEAMQLLKMHKYLNWADKKLHSVFFIENKDQLDEDLLADFKEGGEVNMKTGSTQKKISIEQKQQQVGIKPTEKLFMTHHELLFGQKQSALSKDLVNVNSKNDFPSLGSGLAVENKNQTWGQNIFEQNAPKQKPVQQKGKIVEEAFPTLPESKSIFSTQSKVQDVQQQKFEAPKQKSIFEEKKVIPKLEPPKAKSIFEEQKFEMAKPKDEDFMNKKPGKRGKGKPVAVEVKGNFY